MPATDPRPAVPGPAMATRRAFLAGAGLTAAASLTALRPGTARAATARTGAARVVAENRLSPRVLDLTVDSPALATTAMARLLLPAGWTPQPRRTWPVLYLLHGAEDDYTSWTRSTDVEALTRNADVLVVMPSGGQLGFYSDWWNHGAGGPPRWETFHLTELRRILEAGYGAGASRAVAGLSMGGFGAMSYAGRNPGLFRAAAAYSGVVHTTYQGARGPAFVQEFLIKDGYDPTALWGDYQLNAGVWASHNPYDLAVALAGIPLFVSSGNGTPGPLDPPGTPPSLAIEELIGEMNTAFVRCLRQAGANVTADLYGPGTHNWPYWERGLHRSFSLLMKAIGIDA
ncbi:alpha/beta hydrolase [Actinomadura fibrosa]|uniref:Acyl-CoA:diacylglycerol acyltransferase n=1 Tax=Actinomadura fibrosa TaxID=111802 RepID=A0ABW2XTR8_9ACTN|nr:alpha/beta hydrolase family protein [Actinomadura fibrosa]